jgi:protoporphyrinogen oxidase
VPSADTDYLVVGAGASGLAFADALVSATDVEATVVDRQPVPGGPALIVVEGARAHYSAIVTF